MILNELVHVMKNNCGVGEPDLFLKQGGGLGMTTRAKGKK